MPRYTDATITDAERYLAELQHVRSDGFGLDDAENQSSGRCVAVAIEGLELPAGVSVSAPADRFPMERIEKIVKQLRKVARSLSRAVRA